MIYHNTNGLLIRLKELGKRHGDDGHMTEADYQTWYRL